MEISKPIQIVPRAIPLIVHRLTGVEQLDRIWRLANGSLMAATG
jgi:ABC-type transport system involved in cytochrome bd biosynthesis fused ATPase/permease subunit